MNETAVIAPATRETKADTFFTAEMFCSMRLMLTDLTRTDPAWTLIGTLEVIFHTCRSAELCFINVFLNVMNVYKKVHNFLVIIIL